MGQTPTTIVLHFPWCNFMGNSCQTRLPLQIPSNPNYYPVMYDFCSTFLVSKHNTVTLKTSMWCHQVSRVMIQVFTDVDWWYKPTNGRLIQAELSIHWWRNDWEAQSKDLWTCRLQGPGFELLTLWLVDDGSAYVTSGNQTPTWS